MNAILVNRLARPRRSPQATWARAAILAAGWNLALFLLMPNLLTNRPSSQSSLAVLIPKIDVIRLPRPESQVVRKNEARPVPPPPTRPSDPRPVPQERLSLPFEINPQLPVCPTSLAFPPVNDHLRGFVNDLAIGLPGAFSEGQLDAPLTALVRVPPIYPMNARNRGIEGWVKVHFMVDETGHVGDFEVVEAQPQDLFEQSVRRCVAGWRFKPGTVEGMPVRVKVETTIRFALE